MTYRTQIAGLVVKAPNFTQMMLRTYLKNLDIMPSWIFPEKPIHLKKLKMADAESKFL